jgi:hypothetical protein
VKPFPIHCSYSQLHQAENKVCSWYSAVNKRWTILLY